MGKSVYLSPSTQEKNIGVEGYKTEEIRMNQVCDVTEKILKNHGVTVYRNSPKMSLGEVVRDSNNRNADIHFAFHSNAYNRKSRGCEIFCFRYGGEGEKLSKVVYKKIAAITPTGDRGVKEGYNFYGKGKHMYEVAYTKMPASLIEVAFHDNPDDAKWIMENIEKIGIEIAKGILEYFGIKYQDKFPVTKLAKQILRQTSGFHKDWISFFEANQNVNLSGLIEKLYYKKEEAEKNYIGLIQKKNKHISLIEKTILEAEKKVIQEMFEKIKEEIAKLK
jgi:N-acetylmuramoyl-L-alanine amidase